MAEGVRGPHRFRRAAGVAAPDRDGTTRRQPRPPRAPTSTARSGARCRGRSSLLKTPSSSSDGGRGGPLPGRLARARLDGAIGAWRPPSSDPGGSGSGSGSMAAPPNTGSRSGRPPAARPGSAAGRGGCAQSVSALVWTCSSTRAAGGGATRNAEPASRLGMASERGGKSSTSAEPGPPEGRSETPSMGGGRERGLRFRARRWPPRQAIAAGSGGSRGATTTGTAPGGGVWATPPGGDGHRPGPDGRRRAVRDRRARRRARGSATHRRAACSRTRGSTPRSRAC